ncbi:cytochrome P450 4C1-like, partial [Trichoplusia ni]|uniref:Cytochrome P450 4C1-like n=1 Tax=Trichoplusia ni TaxID=7111 RepID=A0A7E5V8B3_TRINI
IPITAGTHNFTNNNVIRTFVSVVTDPDDTYTVLNTCLEKDYVYEFVKPFLGDSLIAAKVPLWKEQRRLLNPAFNQSLLDTFMGVFNSQSRKLVQELGKEAGKGPFDHWIYARHNALETVFLTSLGVDFSQTDLSKTEYLEALENMFSTMEERLVKFWLHSPYTFAFSDVKKRQDESVKALHRVSNTVLQTRKAELNRNVSDERSLKYQGTFYT